MRRGRKTIGTAFSCAAAVSRPPALGAGAAAMPRMMRIETRVFDPGAAEIQARHALSRTVWSAEL